MTFTCSHYLPEVKAAAADSLGIFHWRSQPKGRLHSSTTSLRSQTGFSVLPRRYDAGL